MSSAREIFFDAPNRVGQGLATYAEMDYETFRQLETMDQVAEDVDAMNTIAVTTAAMDAIQDTDSGLGPVAARSMAIAKFAAGRADLTPEDYAVIDDVATSQTAMDAISVSDTAMDALWESEIARESVAAVAMAIGKFAASLADLHGPDYDDIDDVANDQDAMDAVSTSQTAMDAVSVSTVAMEAVAASALAMDAVIASDDIALPTVVETETAMDAVSTSETAMDAVSSSTLAMDAIWDSQDVAWAAVRDLAMAVGKYVAGRAGLEPQDYADIDAVAADQTAMDAVSTSQTAMDAVSTSQTAMDAVSTSQTAMDAVSASTTAMNAAASAVMPRTKMLLGTHYDSIFSADVGSDRFFNSSVINPNTGSIDGLPYTYDTTNRGNTFDVSLSTDTPSAFDGGNSITCESDNYENEDQAFAEIELDLSDASTLEYWAKDDGDEAVLLIDGDSVNNMGSSFSWTEFSIDVSGYNGTSTIGLGSNFTNSSNYTTYYTGLNLS